MKIGLGTQDNIGQAQNTSQAFRLDQAYTAPRNLKPQQFGLDRVDVSDTAQTAASVIGATGHQRSQQVTNLKRIYQSGQYTVDAAKLSQAIVEQDTDPNHGH
jgi:anti-sigma28 factor (negative regulator of flagellin synthesis)